MDVEANTEPAAGRRVRVAVRLRALGDAVARWASALSPSRALLIALTVEACIALVDHVSGPNVSFTLLYLAPIAFATWRVSSAVGAALAFASAVSSCTVDVATRPVPLAIGVLAWNFVVQLGTLLAVAALLDALRKRLRREQQLARTDPLTHVSNRRAFVELAGVELERSRRTGRPLTVAYLDVDDFKGVNDRLGHAQGDALLAATADALRGATRAMDGVARLGGDEFGLLLVDTDGATAEALVARLRATLAQAVAGRGLAVSFSFGAVTFLKPARSVDEMLRRADDLMYEAKRAGKDQARHLIIRGLAPVRAAAGE